MSFFRYAGRNKRAPYHIPATAKAPPMTDCIDEIHSYWFGPLTDDGMAAPSQHRLWFTVDRDTDEHCRAHFEHWLHEALKGGLDHWAQTHRGLVALVILLDQFCRNIYRGFPEAFSGDERALALVQHTIATGEHRRMPLIHRVFLYLPLEHCENLQAQQDCVALFEEMAAVTGNQQIAEFTRYAIAHRDVIAHFGRFPHRNAILGRESSPEELAYLEKHGGF